MSRQDARRLPGGETQRWAKDKVQRRRQARTGGPGDEAPRQHVAPRAAAGGINAPGIAGDHSGLRSARGTPSAADRLLATRLAPPAPT